MSDSNVNALILFIAVIASLLGYAMAYIRSRNQVDKLREKYVELNEKLSSERSTTTEKFSTVEKMRDGISQTINDLADSKKPSEGTEIDRESFVQSLLKPLQVALHSTDQQAKRISREKEKAGQLVTQQIDIMKAPQKLGRGSSKDIASALGEADTRRHWAINTLKHLLDLSYMTDYCRTCATDNNDKDDEASNATFPPCQIEVPTGEIIAIDTNAPLEPYINICQVSDPSVKTWHSETHARKLRDRIHEMSSRVYNSQFSDAPQLTILLVLNDHYLTSALEVEPELIEDALKQNIVLGTPSDLLSLLQAVSFSWRQQSFSNDAQEIRQTGVNLYRRFGTFAKLLGQLGSELSGVLDSYNKAVTYFESEENSGKQEKPSQSAPSKQKEKKSA